MNIEQALDQIFKWIKQGKYRHGDVVLVPSSLDQTLDYLHARQSVIGDVSDYGWKQPLYENWIGGASLECDWLAAAALLCGVDADDEDFGQRFCASARYEFFGREFGQKWLGNMTTAELSKLAADNEEVSSEEVKLISRMATRKKVSELQDKVDEIESEFRQAKREYETLSANTKEAFKTVTVNKLDIQDIQDRQPKAASSFEPDKCPVCERPMPDAHDYEQYLEEFNQQKAKDLKSARETHENAKEKHVELKAELEAAQKKAANIKGKLKALQDAQENKQRRTT